MTDNLTTMLLGSLDKESQRFAAEHGGDDTTLYERAIAPRRRARRLTEAAGGLAVAGLVALGAYGLLLPRDAVDPAPPATADTVELESREWDPPGTLSPDETAATLVDTWDLDLDDAPACGELDSLARLEGRSDLGGVPVAVGAIAGGDGVNGVTARVFDSADAAAAYLDAVGEAAQGCQAEAAALGLGVDMAEVGLATVAGTGVRVDVASLDEPADTWRAWVHVQDDEALAVVVEPGAEDLAGATHVAWFTAAAR